MLVTGSMAARWDSFVLAVAVVGLTMISSSSTAVSSFVRSSSLSPDMPLDSDVFRVPPGYNAPQQVWFFLVFYIMEFFSFSFFLDLLITVEMILDCSLITLFSSNCSLVYWLRRAHHSCLLTDISFNNYLAWLKVHITQGDHEGKGVIVSWVTPDEPGSNTVLYWAENSTLKQQAHGIVLTYNYFNYTSNCIHHCTIEDLEVRSVLIVSRLTHSLLTFLFSVLV